MLERNVDPRSNHRRSLNKSTYLNLGEGLNNKLYELGMGRLSISSRYAESIKGVTDESR